MSATYRIDLRYDPHSSRYPWDAVVTRLSDDKRVTIEMGPTPSRALDAARDWIRVEEATTAHFPNEVPPTVFVDDQGRDAEAPQMLCTACDGKGERFGQPCPRCAEAPQSVKV